MFRGLTVFRGIVSPIGGGPQLRRSMTIFRSPWPTVDIPTGSVPAVMLPQLEKYGNRPALIDGITGESYSYHEFVNAVNRTAAGLADLGIRSGDVVGLYALNSPDYAVAFHATLLLGATVSTYSPQYAAEEVERQVKDSNTKCMITIPQLMDQIHSVQKVNCQLQHVILFGDHNMEGCHLLKDFIAAHGATPMRLPFPVLDSKTTPAVIPYSSGTTGMPKGVVLSHHNIVANLFQIVALEKLKEDDALIGCLPMFHIYGMSLILNTAMYSGAKIVTLPKFDFELFLRTIQEHKITRAHIAPPVLVPLAKHPLVDKFDLSSLTMLFSGAAPLSSELEGLVKKRLPHMQVKQAYGMTELSPASHINPDSRIKTGSVGPLLPNTECFVRDTATNEKLGKNKPGELCIRGPQVMIEYLNRPDATKQTIDENGFLMTGDVGYVDDDEYFFVVDRVKELIKYKGYQVPPAELEAVLLTHPAVADAAVVPKPDENAGEIPVAFVVLKAGASVDKKDIMEFVSHHVASYRRIRQVEYTDAIPKSAAGKILRKVLRDRIRDEKL